MGMFLDEHPGHEGYVIALVKDDGRWRELGDGDDPESRVTAIQVACDCGWRSPRMHAPLGTLWSPYVTIFPDGDDDNDRIAWPLWREHLQLSPRIHVSQSGRADDCYSRLDLLDDAAVKDRARALSLKLTR